MATVGRSHTPTDRNTPSDRVRTAAKENFALLLSRATTQIALPLSRAPTQNALPRSSAFRSDGVLRSVGGWDLPMLRDRIWFRCVAPARKRAHNHKYGSTLQTQSTASKPLEPLVSRTELLFSPSSVIGEAQSSFPRTSHLVSCFAS